MTLVASKAKTSGITTPGVFLFMVMATLLLAGCASFDNYLKESSDTHYSVSFYIHGIPFFAQEEFQCGPSTLASALNFWGYKIYPEDISKTIYLENIRGTLKMDMVSFVRRYEEPGRISVSEVKGDLLLLKKDLASGYPVVVFVDLGIWNIQKGHYMLMVGYDDLKGGIIAYSGVERDKFISYNRFMRMWERGGYWALRIIPD